MQFGNSFETSLGARHVARIVSLGAASVFGRADIFRVLLYYYSLLAMSAVSVTEYTNIVVIK